MSVSGLPVNAHTEEEVASQSAAQGTVWLRAAPNILVTLASVSRLCLGGGGLLMVDLVHMDQATRWTSLARSFGCNS